MSKRFLFISLLICLLFSLSGCLLRPYRIDIQQGNIIHPAQVNALKTGMSLAEVENRLGRPILENIFYGNKRIYIYTFQKGHHRMIKRYVILYFTNDRLTRIDTDVTTLEGIVLPKPSYND